MAEGVVPTGAPPSFTPSKITCQLLAVSNVEKSLFLCANEFLYSFPSGGERVSLLGAAAGAGATCPTPGHGAAHVHCRKRAVTPLSEEALKFDKSSVRSGNIIQPCLVERGTRRCQLVRSAMPSVVSRHSWIERRAMPTVVSRYFSFTAGEKRAVGCRRFWKLCLHERKDGPNLFPCA